MTNDIVITAPAPEFTAYNGHAAECLCARCCMADMNAHVKRMGWDCTEDRASDKQVSFIMALLARKMTDAPMTEDDARTLGKRQASKFIDTLTSLPDRPRPVVPAPAAAALAVREEIEVGMYARDGEVYKVQVSRESGRLYAKHLVDGKFAYAAGAIRILRASDRMSLEDAAAYGKRTGTCCVCGIELTNPESVEAGIGPICRTKF